MLTYKLKPFNQLSLNELYAILALRAKVFVVEQECAYLDLDYNDQQSMHLMAYIDSEFVAYTRILPHKDTLSMSIGRVVTNFKHRGFGYGKAILKESIDYLDDKHRGKTIKLSAQHHLVKFYNALGFIEQGDIYDEDGIPHILMVRR
jgi:ElaA protein